MEQNGLYSVNQNGEIRYYMTDKPINDLIQTAQNNNRAFIELGELGDRISEPNFAEIEQGSRVNYSIYFDLDYKNARIYLINGGKGGIIDPERNYKNTSMVEYRLDNDDNLCVIDADTAVGMVEHGFSVYMDGTDRQITYEQIFNMFDYTDLELEQHSFFALRSEFEQNGELETLTDDIDRLNDEVLSKDSTYSIDDYAKDLNNMGDSSYRWRDGRSEWQNICDSILSGNTEYIHLWLNDISNNFEVGQIAERLKSYEDRYQRERDTINHDKNAVPTAIRGESRGNTMAEHNTKMEVSSMVSLEGSSAKAVATVVINDEFALKGIKVFESDKGLFVAMPSRKIDGEYADVCFPITSDAREQLNKVVLEQYDDMLAKGMEKYQAEKNNPPEKGLSDITVSLHRVNDEHTKATGQIVIDNCIVVSGVKVKHGTNSEGIEKDFVSMPQYQTQTGEYNQYANPITKDCYEKINNAVLNAYEKLEKTEYRGAKFSELGDKADVSTQYGLNPKYAEKVMDALDKQGIKYFAKSYEGKTSISVNNADRQTLDKTQKDVTASLKQAKEKTADKPEHKPKAKTH